MMIIMSNIEFNIKLELEVKNEISSYKINNKLGDIDYFIENGMENKHTHSIVLFSYLNTKYILNFRITMYLITELISFIKKNNEYKDNIVKINKISFSLNSFDLIQYVDIFYQRLLVYLRDMYPFKKIDPKFECSANKVNYTHKSIFTIEKDT